LQRTEFPSGQPVPDRLASPAVNLTALLEQGDVQFVRLAYQVLLGRQVDDDGLTNYLAQLRSGADKCSVLIEIASSLEGRRLQIQVPGLDKLLAAPRPRRSSSLVRFLQRLAKPLHTPTESLERGWRIVDNHLHRLEAKLADQAAEISALRSDLNSMRAQVESAATSAVLAPATGLASAPLGVTVGRLVPPRARQLLDDLRRTRALRLRVEQW